MPEAAQAQTPPPSAKASAPAPQSTAPAPSSEKAEGAKDFDFDSFDKEFDGDTSEPVSDKTSKAAEAKLVEEQDSPAPQPAEKSEPVQETVQAEKAPEASPPKAPEREAQKPPTPEEQRAQYTQWRTNSEKRLTDLYKLSEEDGERMLTKPEEVLPKLAARLHMDVYEAVLHDFQTRMPHLITSIMRQETETRKYEDQFYAKFPALKPHHETVLKFAQAFRQLDPSLKGEAFMEQVGAAAMAALRLQAPTPPAQSSKSPETIAKEIVRPGTGFAPAPTGSTVPPQAKAPLSPWEQMAVDILEDET